MIEQKLWRKVLERAILDTEYDGDVFDDIGRYDDLPKPTRDRVDIWLEADAWFRDNSDDFKTACHHAGIDPDIVRNKYLSGTIDIEYLKW